MSKYTPIAAIIFAALSLTGCTKDNAAFTSEIHCTVHQATLTKAAEANIDALKTSGFTMLAIIDEGAHDYDNDEDYTAGPYFTKSVSWDGSKNWNIADSPKWVNNVTMRFWCWTPATELSINPDNTSLIGSSTLPFTYTMPAGGSTDASDHANDAASQNDILFSYNSCLKTSASSKDSIALKFYHPLSNIKFCVIPTTGAQTSGDGTFKASYKIVSIALQNVSSSGECTMTGQPYTSISTVVAPSFAWSNQANPTTYTQYYGAEFLDNSTIKCPDGWTSKVANEKTVYTANEGFFIIPQTIGADTRLAVTFDINSKNVTKTVLLKDVDDHPDKWEPGKYYTYNIGISAEFGSISVTLGSMTIGDTTEW